MKVIVSVWVLIISINSAFSQSVVTRNNYSGDWKNPGSWMPVWADPKDTLYGTDVHIYGCITSDRPICLTGNSSALHIRDTLIINGNLYLKNNKFLTIDTNGILIIRGDLIITNNASILNSGHIILTGKFENNSSTWGGFFSFNDSLSNVFIGETVDAPQSIFYPVLDCTDTNGIHYTYSGCNYGNMTDLLYDPIYSFFSTLCHKAQASYNGPICEKDTLKLFAGVPAESADLHFEYDWTGPEGFATNMQNPVMARSDPGMSGSYVVKVDYAGCVAADTVQVNVNPLPDATAGSNSPVCEGETLLLSAQGGSRYNWTGTGGFMSLSQNPSLPDIDYGDSGWYSVKVTSSEGCSDTAHTFVEVKSIPQAHAGEDQLLEYVFETTAEALVGEDETGTWALISGAGIINTPGFPVTEISGLSEGENVFRWTVQNGNCRASDDIVITVRDLFVPSVITPNDDGKNDYFMVRGCPAGTELILFNRWGMMEFSSSNYKNEWSGKDNHGQELPDDTYFYVLKLPNGIVKKGTVLIKRK